MKKHEIYEKLKHEHFRLGFWDNSEENARYRYVLSPDNFLLDDNYRTQLETIGKDVVIFQKNMRTIANIAVQNPGDHTSGLIGTMLKKANDGLPQILIGDRNVPICKVDIMIDSNDKLQIAEIDAYNPRGTAYMIMMRHLYTTCVAQDKKLFPGIISYFEKYAPEEMMWVFAKRERYYGNVMKIAGNILKETTGKILKPIASTHINGEIEKNQLILPYGMSWAEELRTKNDLLKQYEDNPQKFFYPLVPWLGTKGLLGVISDPTNHENLAALKPYFHEDVTNIKKHLPEVVLVGKKFKDDVQKFREQNPHVVLKSHVASGMKGVWMPGNQDFEKEFALAENNKRSQHILQTFVNQKQFSLKYFDEQGQERKNNNWYVRLIAYIAHDGTVVDAEITARPSPDVHGAPDCLQIPCVLS